MRIKRIPALSALRTFEAAGRHSSFTLAAAELNVTPGAISRQIKYLEEELGVALFERRHREVHLTEYGRTYLSCLTEAFDRIWLGTEELLSHHAAQLNVFCSMTLTMRWLVPRMVGFHRTHPKHELCIHTPIPTPLHLRKSRASIAVRMGDDDWKETKNIKLFDIKLIPVCSPKLIPSFVQAKESSIVNDYPLLVSLARPDDWKRWAGAAGVQLDPPSILQFESSSLAFEAALNGVGIAIGQLALVRDDLKSGRLIAPVALVHGDNSYVSLAARPDFVNDALFKDFRDWIVAEAQTSVQEEDAFCRANRLVVC